MEDNFLQYTYYIYCRTYTKHNIQLAMKNNNEKEKENKKNAKRIPINKPYKRLITHHNNNVFPSN